MQRRIRSQIILTIAVLLSACHPVKPQRYSVKSVTNGTYVIKSRHSGKCLDVADGSTADGALIRQWDCNNTNAQKFRVTPTNDGFIRIENVNSGRALDAYENRTANGTPIQQWSYGGGENQQWRLVQRDEGSYAIVARAAGRVIEVDAWSKESGAKVQLWDDGNTPNQQWFFEGGDTPVVNSPSPPPPSPSPNPGPGSGKIQSFADIGSRSNGRLENNVAITEGVIRVRRRHENDMDFSKYNPFYWEGRLTNFKVEDFTPAGENRIKFSMITEWPQDNTVDRGPDFSAVYTGNPDFPDETLRSKFAINARMTRVGTDDRHFEFEMKPQEFQAHGLAKGQLLVFEFRFFMKEAHPDWQKQKARNGHNLSAYYSEFFRVRIGEAGLYIDQIDDVRAMPDPRRYSGGWTTLPTSKVEPWRALQQQSLNLSFGNAQKFLMGRTWFHTDMGSGQHVGDEADDKPSVFYPEMEADRRNFGSNAFNVRSCNGCHLNNGTFLLPPEGQPVHATVVKTLNRDNGQDHAQFGGQLQTQGDGREGNLKISRYEQKTVILADGTQVNLRKPIFAVENGLYDTGALALSPRRTPALIGIGLLDAVPESTLRELAAKSNGEISMVNGRVGRFGWKAGQPTARDQIIGALKNDMGVLSSEATNLDCKDRCQAGKGPIPNAALDEMEAYVSLLGVPARDNPGNPQVMQGEQVFQRLGCQNCHAMMLRTGSSKFPELSNQTIQAFTDLLLHDMGDGLADDNKGPNARKWRTAPLWGLKSVKHATDSRMQQFPSGRIDLNWKVTHAAANGNRLELLHDGRAQSIAEAILWHGGAAQAQSDAYKGLSKADRDALEAFLWDL